MKWQARVTKLQARVTKLLARFTKLQDKGTNLQAQLTKWKSKMKRHIYFELFNRLVECKTVERKYLNKTKLEARVTKLEARVTKLQARLTNFKSGGNQNAGPIYQTAGQCH